MEQKESHERWHRGSSSIVNRDAVGSIPTGDCYLWDIKDKITFLQKYNL